MRGWLSTAALLSFCLAALAVGARAAGTELAGDRVATEKSDLVIHPVRHASLVIEWNGKTIYVDPVGGAKSFSGLPRPDLVLVTHIHFDHYPYHYRGGDGAKADLEEFKRLVGKDAGVEVRARNWYPEG